MITGVLFDLDGVVIDSESVYTEFWENMEQRFPTGIDNFALRIKGSTLPEILDTYYPDPKCQEQIKQQILAFEKDMKYIPFPEAMRFIKELNDANIKCAIVTSSSQRKMENLYAQNPDFRTCFNAVITGDMVSHSKPHPEPYLTGARAIGANIADCYVFEDSLSGIQSGISAGATVIGLATTLPFCQIKEKAHKTISGFIGFHISDMLSVNKL